MPDNIRVLAAVTAQVRCLDVGIAVETAKGSLILASACPFLGFFPRFLSVTATLDAVFVNPRAKRLHVRNVVATALLKRDDVVGFVAHSLQPTHCTCIVVAQEDALPQRGASASANAWCCPGLLLQRPYLAGAQHWQRGLECAHI